jgi:hypothetical protein
VNNSRGQPRNKLQKQPTKTEKPENQHPLITKDTANAKKPISRPKTKHSLQSPLCPQKCRYAVTFLFLKKEILLQLTAALENVCNIFSENSQI